MEQRNNFKGLVIIALFACVFVISMQTYADNDLDVYEFNDLFIFSKFGESQTREFNIVPLKDDEELRIVGKISTLANNDVGAFSHYNDFLIVLLWNRVEIFDLSKPDKPIRMALYELKEHKSWPGFSRIVESGSKFVVLSSRSTAELIFDGKNNYFVKKDIERTEKLQKETLAVKSIFPSFDEPRDKSFIIKETDEHRFELIVITTPFKKGVCEVKHKKLLRKIQKENGNVKSSLLLGYLIETGCDAPMPEDKHNKKR